MATQQTMAFNRKSLQVLPPDTLRAIHGANEGDVLSISEDLVLDDVYTCAEPPDSASLLLTRKMGHYVIAQGSDAGTVGARLHLDSILTLMEYGTQVTEVLLLVEVDSHGNMASLFLLPLSPLRARAEYRLVGIQTEGAEQKLAQLACVSFTRGTQISLSTGRLVAVEELNVGDLILTRDDGAQPLRWIGQNTQRAEGAFAPIRIAAGTLNNLGDLVVSPGHRLFFYQRSDHIGAGRSELLINARHLVNGSSVTVERGGFVDYFQLLFDCHQIIFAEGIAAESMRVNDNTASLVDAAILKELQNAPAGPRDIDSFDVQRALLERPDVVNLLRKASKG